MKAKLFAKYEKYNPAGSVKDRIALELGQLHNELEKDVVGIFSGAALAVAIRLAQKEEYNNKVIVVLSLMVSIDIYQQDFARKKNSK